jgi:two-component system sensor histidine kinase EvgS
VLESRVQERTAELSLANSKLQELDRLKSLFIASVSHELRTPLNSIIGFSSLMKQATYGELNEKYTDYISRINLSGQHLLSLITDIIDISKIESGFVDVELSDFAVDNLRQQAKKKGLTMEVTLPPKLTLHTDRRRLLQCLLNFLSNAIKYSEQGHITVLAEDKGKQVVLSVRDSGIGIKTEDMPLLFEAFERIDTHLRVKAGGTGLGLYLTNKIATELLQGEVGAISKTGKGSTFWIKIPKNLQQ